MACRWREDNCHAQCRSCNRFDEGNAVGYTMFMIEKYGKEHVEYLQAIKNTGWKPTEFELQVLIDEYKEKLKQFQPKLLQFTSAYAILRLSIRRKVDAARDKTVQSVLLTK